MKKSDGFNVILFFLKVLLFLLLFVHQDSIHLDKPERSADFSVIASNLMNEFNILGGLAIVNSRDSENDIAFMMEYRRRIGDNFDWTVGFLNEGNPGPIKRNGVLTQFWLVQRFFQDRLGIGVAAGPYIPLDGRRDYESGGKDDPFLAAMDSPAQLEPNRHRLRPGHRRSAGWHRVPFLKIGRKNF